MIRVGGRSDAASDGGPARVDQSADRNRARGDESARKTRLEAELTRIERRLRRIVDAIADGAPVRALREELHALETRQDQLRAELAAAPEGQEPLLHPNLADVFHKKMRWLTGALAEETTREEAFELIRSLVDKVVLVPEGEELRIELHGELGAILALCQQARTPGGGRALAEQIKGVAGAGFGLCALFIASGLEGVARRL